MKTSLRTISLFLFAELMLTACASHHPIHGTYTGKLASAWDIRPAQTTFEGGGDQPLTAEYQWHEANPQYGEPHLEQGSLQECSLNESRILSCTWRDRFGSGKFEALFSEDFTSFSGAWGDRKRVYAGHPWTGKK